MIDQQQLIFPQASHTCLRVGIVVPPAKALEAKESSPILRRTPPHPTPGSVLSARGVYMSSWLPTFLEAVGWSSPYYSQQGCVAAHSPWGFHCPCRTNCVIQHRGCYWMSMPLILRSHYSKVCYSFLCLAC